MLHKTGAPSKIRTVASSDVEYEKLKEQVVAANNLMRCAKCGKLLAKVEGNLVNIKRKDVDIIATASELHVKCPVCGTTNSLETK